jgi:hypothetical protein
MVIKYNNICHSKAPPNFSKIGILKTNHLATRLLKMRFSFFESYFNFELKVQQMSSKSNPLSCLQNAAAWRAATAGANLMIFHFCQ